MTRYDFVQMLLEMHETWGFDKAVAVAAAVDFAVETLHENPHGLGVQFTKRYGTRVTDNLWDIWDKSQ